jgi:hypothetical protein
MDHRMGHPGSLVVSKNCVIQRCQGSIFTAVNATELRVFENRVLRIFGPKREEDGS